MENINLSTRNCTGTHSIPPVGTKFTELNFFNYLNICSLNSVQKVPLVVSRTEINMLVRIHKIKFSSRPRKAWVWVSGVMIMG